MKKPKKRVYLVVLRCTFNERPGSQMMDPDSRTELSHVFGPHEKMKRISCSLTKVRQVARRLLRLSEPGFSALARWATRGFPKRGQPGRRYDAQVVTHYTVRDMSYRVVDELGAVVLTGRIDR